MITRRPDLSHLPHNLADYLVCGYDLLVARAAEDAPQDYLIHLAPAHERTGAAR